MPTPNQQPAPKFDFAEPTNRTPPVPDAFKSAPPGAITKFEPPPPTRIYPQPINPPVSPPAPAPTPVPAPRAAGRSGGRIAGSFKMPPGAGVAARGGAAVVGRRIPYVALAFLAYDAYQLACSFQLIPGSICPRPDNPSPGGKTPDFSGGQCFGILYIVSFKYERPGEGFERDGGNLQTRNRIDGMVSTSTTSEVSWRLKTTQLSGATQLYDVLFSQVGTVCRISRIVRADGGVDNCGNPQPQPQPQRLPDQINNINNFGGDFRININVPAPAPPTPQPKRPPLVISPPSPLPSININFGGDNFSSGGQNYSDGGDDLDINIDFNFSPAPKGNFNDPPDTFNNFPPAPQPKTKNPDPFPKDNPAPQPAPQPKPVPELPPPLPDKLPENSTDEDKYIYRQNKETLDKVYKANAEILEIQEEQKKQRKILENIQSLLDFEIEGSQLIKRCDDVEIFYSYKDKVLKAISKQLDHVKAIEQTIINEVCSVEASSVVASPDWWGVRLQADVPQICLIFRVALSRTYHRLTIPHPLNTGKLLRPPIETYEKGNWMAEIMCIDNSKFIGNFKTRDEAIRVGNIALSLIHPDWKGENPRVYLAERKGVAVAEGSMTATSAMYFSTGQKNMMPDWRVPFKLDGV